MASIEHLVRGDEARRREELTEALYTPMLEYPLRSAKALRPAISHAMCVGLGKPVSSILPSATVLELFHNAFLIHDDIEDRSLIRRGSDTLHRRHGTPIAINVGDAMLALALKPLLDNMAVLGMGPSLRILQIVFDMARQSTEGQAIELAWIRARKWSLTDEDYLDMVRQKTSVYTFVAPLLIGATAGGATHGQRESLRELGVNLGAAFQIHDDLLNLTDDAASYGKECWGDLWEGKRTIIVLHALRCLSPRDSERARDILDRPRPDLEVEKSVVAVLPQVLTRHVAAGALSDEAAAKLLADVARTAAGTDTKDDADVAWLRDVVEQTGALAHARRVAATHRELAHTAFRSTAEWLPASNHRQFLSSLITYATERCR